MAGIPITLNFDLKAPLPLDSRLLIANTSQLNNINPKYSGMIVYAANTKKLYYLEDLNTNTWSQIGTGSFGGGISLNNVVYTSGDQSISGSKTFIATGFYYSGGFYRYDKQTRTVFEENVFINKINDQTSFGIYNHYFLNKSLPISGQLTNLPVGIRTGNIVNLFFNNSGINNSIENNILVEPTVMIRYTGNSFPNNIIPITGHQFYRNRALKKINYNGITENVVYTTGNQLISGTKNFISRPTVNGTGVLLSGEIPRLPDEIVYTTGNQVIIGEKEFNKPTAFTNLLEATSDRLIFNSIYTGRASGDFEDYSNLGLAMSMNSDGTILGIGVNNYLHSGNSFGPTTGVTTKCYIYTREDNTTNWQFKEEISRTRRTRSRGIQSFHFSPDGSALFLGWNERIDVYTGSKSTSWNNLAHTLTGGYIISGENRFGESLAFNRDCTVIAAPDSSDGTLDFFAGKVSIFTGSINNGWRLKQTIFPSGGNLRLAIYGKPKFSDDGSVLFIGRGNAMYSKNYIDIFTGSSNNGWVHKQQIEISGNAFGGFWPTDTYIGSNISCSPDGSTFIFTQNQQGVNPAYSNVQIWSGNKNNGWQLQNSLSSNMCCQDFLFSRCLLSRDGEYIIQAHVQQGGDTGGIYLWRKTSTNNYRLAQTIYAGNDLTQFVPNIGMPQIGIRIAGGKFGSFMATDDNFNNVLIGAPFADIIWGRPGCIGSCVDHVGYAVSFHLAEQSLQINSQETNAPMLNVNGEVAINSPFRPKYNNTGILLQGEAVETNSDAQLNSLKFKNVSDLSLDGPRLLSKNQGSGVATSINIFSDSSGEIIDFTETGVSFNIRPRVNGSGVLLQGEATANGGVDPFNGNRSITLNVAGFKDVNAGGNTVSGFLNNLFFPFVPATISLNPYPLQELGTTFGQIPFTGSITQNSETIISNLQYFLGPVGNTILLGNVANPSFGPFNTGFNLPLVQSSVVRVVLNRNNNGSPDTTTSTQNIIFIAPSWYGAGVNGLITGVQNMAKYLNTKANRTFTFNTTNNHFYYAYPNDWGLLTSIIDQNGFNITPSFSNTTGNLLLANNSTSYTYRIYQSINPSSNTNFNITFNF